MLSSLNNFDLSFVLLWFGVKIIEKPSVEASVVVADSASVSAVRDKITLRN